MTTEVKPQAAVAELMDGIGRAARGAAQALALSSSAERNRALQCIATRIRASSVDILAANKADLGAARQQGLGHAMLDRLMLDANRLDVIAAGVDAIAAMPDPIGRVISQWQRPNGLAIQRISVPLGVIGIIYESRPNVTIDAAALCLKSANAAILRGGSESFRSNTALHACVRAGLSDAGINVAAVQLVPTTDRDAVGYLLSSMSRWLDVVVPRGGKGLIRRVQEDARVPVIGHLDGICHVYLHTAAEVGMARDITVNAKMRRTGICGAAETLLVDRANADTILPPVANALLEAGCELRGDAAVCAIVPQATLASEADWATEYLDAVISIRIVDDIEQAMQHIRQFGSAHTECIVTEDQAAADRFCREVDSAIVLHNASTQFADGGEFGMGAEIGIATGRVHARGPVGAAQLTSYKYVVHGCGQVRG
ncbi:MAG: glutamate-5-semialdehyde dehydrogenase [Gammaproteobacteria bacterium]|nr:glutamate-5-semialdehyde dehydrogenase [Gammaproteobacteria bacterium]MDH5302538.1 glutamate-5-semialdehyde dehydrogenase [Gammaproteobacteria bacterium]MDH5321914.1 glutamate-5-semialdehyde dehydrogenase [Gammaproteobacteria bacterium]